ncbi:Uncharacterized protein DAT39_006224, partial [Clarias magur]
MEWRMCLEEGQRKTGGRQQSGYVPPLLFPLFSLSACALLALSEGLLLRNPRRRQLNSDKPEPKCHKETRMAVTILK